MSDAAQLTRQWLLLRKLCRRHSAWTLKELAGEFGVSPKTIQRDFHVLRSVGFPLRETVGHQGLKTWRCETDSMLTGLTFTLDELAALYLGRRFLEPLAGTYLWDASQKAYHKIRSGLGADAICYLERLATVFHRTAVGLSDYSERGRLIDMLMQAAEERRVARLLYRSLQSDQPREATVHPYGIVNHRTALYLVAHVPEYDQLRHYKLDRIHDVELLDEEPFDRRDGFDLEDHFAGAFGIYHGDGPLQEVRIRFAPEAARYVEEHRWHASQQLEKSPDGSLLLTLELTQLEEVKSWILSFGSKATVEGPEELRELIAEEISSLAEQYRRVPPRQAAVQR